MEAPHLSTPAVGVVSAIRKFLHEYKRRVDVKRNCTVVLWLVGVSDIMMLIRVFVSLLALTFLACSPVVGLQRSDDGRVMLNIGFLTSKTGRFSSEGK